MGTHVNHEVTRPVELMPTKSTLVRLDSRVRSHVLHQAAGQHELLAAQLTLLRTLARVWPHVNHAMPRPLERLLTDRAGVGLDSGVRCDMRHQHVGAGKPPPTLIAAVRTLASVGPHVRRKVAQRSEHATAVLARMLLHRRRLAVRAAAPSTPTHVIRERRQLRVLLVAAKAAEHVLTTVFGLDVFVQLTRVHEVAAADATHVRLHVTAVSAQVSS